MLTTEELLAIKELQEVCEKAGGFLIKLNFDMLENRPANIKEDFFHYENGRLVGFLGSYGFGSKVELCGMVHPEYRRSGIFSRLLQLALDEAEKRNVTTVLLNAPTQSRTAKEFLKTIPCTFLITEYQMKWKKTELIDDPAITIRPSFSKEDKEAEIQLDVAGFGMNENDARKFNEMVSEYNFERQLIIETNGKIAGKIRVSEQSGEAWIYGFVVLPELRGKGIGRKALSKVVNRVHQKGLPIFLEVEAENIHALRLYESCGFRSYHSQDYYEYR